MPPKKKGVAMKLGDFMNDESTGKVDWADDVENLQLDPLPSRGVAGSRRGDDWLSSQPDRGDRERMNESDRSYDRGPPRQELALPTAPPYTAFVGNLSFDVREPEVEDFLAPSKCTSIRMVNGPDGRAKGFGYVEFETLDGLKDALTKSGSQWMGRTVRISVAEPRDARAGGNSMAEEASQWRRAGPLPTVETPMGARRGVDRPGFGRQESGPASSGFDSMENRSGFGAKFTPAPPSIMQQPARRLGPGGPGFGMGGGGNGLGPGPESLEPSVGDNASDWRTGKPMAETLASPSIRRPSGSPAGPMGPGVDGANRGAMRSGSRGGDATDVDERFANQERLGFGSKFVATPPDSPGMAKRPGFGFDRRSSNAPSGAGGAPASGGPSEDADTWRSASRKPSVSAVAEGGSPTQAAAIAVPAPAQRKKLELKPRTVPAAGSEGYDANAAAVTNNASGRANPFGSAKPIDAGEREKEIEAKIATQEQDRKEEEKKRKEEDKKRKDKLRVEREKAQAQAPRGPKADRNKSRGPTSEKGSETSSTPTVEKEMDRSSSVGTPTPAAAAASDNSTGPKPAPPTGAWGKGRKPSGALVSGDQSPEVQAAINGSSSGKEESNGKHGVEAAEVHKAVESLSAAQD